MRIEYKYVGFPDDLHHAENTYHSMSVSKVEYDMLLDKYVVTITYQGALTT